MSIPSALLHRFSFSVIGDDGASIERTVNGPVIAVVQELAPVLHAPLHGSGCVAFNALAAYDHRRAFNPFDGRIRIAQCFAIDWMRLGLDRCLFHGEKKRNADFYSYGAEVLAVADARVSDLEDRVPDNIGVTERKSRLITVDNAVGNYVTLDLGHGRFALYAHLQPGSLRVKVGDNVKAGQALALIGNSGNSDAPHLHFQLTDGNSPMGSEGIPYEFETFTQLGVIDGPDVLDSGKAWPPNAGEKPVVHHREFPLNNGVVTFA